MQTSAASIPWQDVDTVLLDMDGTLLDLAFDNYFWLELVPARYAELTGLGAEEAHRRIALRYQSVIGSLDWYCIDYWSRELELDIAALKWGHRHLISYLPGARSFLRALRERGKPFSIVTNAHPDTIRVKTSETRLNTLVDGVVCSHELRAPKESAEFWKELQRRQPFDPERTLLIEDSLPVLTAARRYGLRYTVAVRQPDSRQPARSIEEFPSVVGVGDLIPL